MKHPNPLCALAAAALAVIVTFVTVSAQGQGAAATSVQKGAGDILVTEGDITDRPYRVLGDISVTVRSTAIVDVPPLRDKVTNALKEKAAAMRADAVILVRYETTSVEFFSLGHMDGRGRAVVFENPSAAGSGQGGAQAGAATGPTPAAANRVQSPTQAEMKAKLQSYVDLLNAGNANAVIALYSDDATVEDPVGSLVKHGKEVETFIRDGVARGLKYELVAPIRGSNTDAATMAIKARLGTTVINATEIFTFYADGKIASMKAYWGSEDREIQAR